MMYFPTRPLELASPSANVELFEFRRSRTDSIADAHRKITRAVYSVSCRVRASITRTPLARDVFGSYRISDTTLFGRSVMRPVARAAGSVAAMLLKYEWVMHPFSHGPQ